MSETVSESGIVKLVTTLTNAAVNGVGPLESSIKLAANYLADKKLRSNKAKAEALVKWEVAKNFGSGFLTGLGGFVTLPVTLPTGMAAAWMVQARMVGAIAEIYGYSVKDERVQTMILLCMLGSDMARVLKDCGVKVATKVTQSLVSRMPGKVLVEINKRVGMRLVTKAGEKGIVNLTKVIPFVGGLVSGTVDAVTCKSVGSVAIKVFSSKARG